MRADRLKQMEKAPAQGWLLAYTRKEVLFQPYGTIEEVAGLLADKDLLEIHLFDDRKEYRAVMSTSRRYPEGIIEAVADFADDGEEDVYKEVALLEKRYLGSGRSALTIVDHLKYAEDSGMLTIDDYRLM